MKAGFLKGVIVGTVLGTMSSMLIDPNNRQKAKSFVDRGGQILQSAQAKFETAESWIDKGRNLFQNNGQANEVEEKNSQSSDCQIYDPDGKENITERVAILEKRLEELSQKGV